MAFAIIKRGASKGGYFAIPAIGPSFFISEGQLTQFNLYENQELSESEFNSLKERLLSQRCRKWALDALTRREHSRKELQLKLRLKEFPPHIIDKELDYLQEHKLLSDERFTTQFIASRQRRDPEGAVRLTQRLREKGIDQTLIEKSIKAYFDEGENLVDALVRAVERVSRRKSLNLDQIKNHLYKKGFSYSEIKLYVEHSKEPDN